MNSVNKTLYIPLYGKAYVSRKGIILWDKKAEEIWSKERFPLKGKSRSKWLSYYMGMRAAVFDNWVKKQCSDDAVVIHIGCGMDSRCIRVGLLSHYWYDVDMPEVINERKRYYTETGNYKMIAADVRDYDWIISIPEAKSAVIVMEGVCMYLKTDEIQGLFKALANHFDRLHIFMDCYTTVAAKASRIRNPINDVGVTTVYGIDDPKILEEGTGISFLKEHEITPIFMINELNGMDKLIFKWIYAGSISKRMYRMYEYTS